LDPSSSQKNGTMPRQGWGSWNERKLTTEEHGKTRKI
jgi:hypothetical protein